MPPPNTLAFPATQPRIAIRFAAPPLALGLAARPLPGGCTVLFLSSGMHAPPSRFTPEARQQANAWCLQLLTTLFVLASIDRLLNGSPEPRYPAPKRVDTPVAPKTSAWTKAERVPANAVAPGSARKASPMNRPIVRTPVGLGAHRSNAPRHAEPSPFIATEPLEPANPPVAGESQPPVDWKTPEQAGMDLSTALQYQAVLDERPVEPEHETEHEPLHEPEHGSAAQPLPEREHHPETGAMDAEAYARYMAAFDAETPAEDPVPMPRG